MNSTPELLDLSGPARIRAMFHPRQRIGLIDAGKLIGVSYSRLFRRIQEGKLDLRVRKDEYGQMYVTIDDLAAYLFPDNEQS
jgi:phosphatidate phosphatase PAH1